MFGCYRKGDANDPETYTAAITAILAEYSPEVVQFVTDPRTGIARRIGFLPTVKEVSDECDRARDMIANREYLQSKGWTLIDGKWVKPEGQVA